MKTYENIVYIRDRCKNLSFFVVKFMSIYNEVYKKLILGLVKYEII